MFTLYTQWTVTENEHRLSNNRFGTFLKKALNNFEWDEDNGYKRSNGRTLYRGFKLRANIQNYRIGEYPLNLSVSTDKEDF
jgi:hypothetical protein